MSKKILVVDDEKLIVKGICFSLEQEGMEVDCAYDGSYLRLQTLTLGYTLPHTVLNKIHIEKLRKRRKTS